MMNVLLFLVSRGVEWTHPPTSERVHANAISLAAKVKIKAYEGCKSQHFEPPICEDHLLKIDDRKN